MAKKCYYVTYTNCLGASGDAYLCAEDLEYRSGGRCGGGYFSSADLGYNADNASEQQGTVTQVSSSNCPNCVASIEPTQPYDCLNGGCVPKTTYNTPGVYVNLAACQSGCAKNSNCTGECVSSEELAALQQAANNLKSRLCK
jgi:hypothetical protein